MKTKNTSHKHSTKVTQKIPPSIYKHNNKVSFRQHHQKPHTYNYPGKQYRIIHTIRSIQNIKFSTIVTIEQNSTKTKPADIFTKDFKNIPDNNNLNPISSKGQLQDLLSSGGGKGLGPPSQEKTSKIVNTERKNNINFVFQKNDRMKKYSTS